MCLAYDAGCMHAHMADINAAAVSESWMGLYAGTGACAAVCIG
jgi:hypothetical protein